MTGHGGNVTSEKVSAGAIVLLLFAAISPLTGCVAVGYRSGGGWFVWPGGIGLVVILLVVLLVLRGRR